MPYPCAFCSSAMVTPKVATSVGAGSEGTGLATYTEDNSGGGLSLRSTGGAGNKSRGVQDFWKHASNTPVHLEGRSMSVDWTAGKGPAGCVDLSDPVAIFTLTARAAAESIASEVILNAGFLLTALIGARQMLG